MEQDPIQEADYVKLFKCPSRECFHLVAGKVTVHLTPRELLLLGAVIDQWWREHPDHLRHLKPFM